MKSEFEERLYENYQIVIPLLTLAELCERNDLLLQLIEFSKEHRILISKSSLQLFEEEIQTFESNTPTKIELINLSASVLDNESHMKDYFVSDEFIQAATVLKNHESVALKNIEILRKYNYENREDYVSDYLFTKLSQKAPEIYHKYNSNRENPKLNHFHSVLFQGTFLFYKYNKKNIKSIASDINDALIIPFLPYVDMFITERTNGSLINELKPKEHLIQNLDVLLFRDIKCE